MADQHDFSGLSEGERRLVEAAMAGEDAQLEDTHDIPAGLIVALACGLPFGGRDRPFPLARPRLYVQGGKVSGRLDFAGRTVPVSLILRAMTIPDGIDLVLSEIRDIDLDESIIGPIKARGAIVRGSFSAEAATLSRLEDGGDAFSAQSIVISGALFLNNATLKGGCDIVGAEIGGQIAAAGKKTLFDNPGGNAIIAQGAEIKGGVFLYEATLKGCCNIAGARIGGQFSALGEKTLFDNPGGDAINAQGVTIKDSVFLGGATLKGCCDINNASIGGQFAAEGEKTLFDNPDGKAINAQGVTIIDSVFLGGATLKGCCDINNASIGGQFAAEGEKTLFDNPGGDAINAQGAEIKGDVFLQEATLKGACDFAGANISGQFSASGKKTLFNNPGGNAINAQRAQIREGMYLNNATLKGCCAINGASIGGQLAAAGEKTLFDNPGGDAINAQGAEIKGDVFLHDATLKGCCYFAGASIGGQFAAAGENTLFDNPGGNAIFAQGAEIRGGAFLRQATLKGNGYFVGASIMGRFDLETTNLMCGGACEPKQTGKCALNLKRTQIAHLVMPAKHAPQGLVDLSNAHIGLLEDFKSGWPQRAAGTDTVENYLILDGLTYDRLARPDGEHESGEEAGQSGGFWKRLRAWTGTRLRAVLPFLRRKRGSIESNRIGWLMLQPPEHIRTHFRPQPWRQLALTLAKQGYEDEAKGIAVERRVRTRHAGGMGAWRKTVDWFLHRLANYGFDPWMTVRWSALAVLVFAIIYAGAAHWGCDGDTGCANQAVYVRTQPADFVPAAILSTDIAEEQLRTVYPAFNPWLYSLDAFVPLFDLGMETYWRPRDNYSVSLPAPLTIAYGEGRSITLSAISVGQMLIWLYVFQKFLGAILIALIVTGFTGLLSREEKV